MRRSPLPADLLASTTFKPNQLKRLASLPPLPFSSLTDENGTTEQVVDPWNVQAGEDGQIDYEKLVEQFGCTKIPDDLIKRMERLTGRKAHIFLRRGFFFCHRDLEMILDLYEAGKPFYLYTGRGPSAGMHLGHLIPFLFTKWLQEAFNVPLVVQMTDDEKFLWKDMTMDQVKQSLVDNVKDIIALGFDATKTFIFSDFVYVGHMYPNIVQIQRLVTGNQARGIFGFDWGVNIGKLAFPAVQAAPSFSTSFPHMFGPDSRVQCLIPAAVDQDPYFRLTRDVAPRMGLLKPAMIYSKFFPALQGPGTKMSSSVSTSAIFLTDTPKMIKKKINSYAFSGGGETEADQREKGADLEVDTSFQWLRFFLDDDKELEDIGRRYKAGEMMTGEVKAVLIKVLTEVVTLHQKAKELVTDDVVDAFMEIRSM